MFNSPIQYCPVCKQQVALDQTKNECAHEQRCKAENCPLSYLFMSPDSVGEHDDKPNPDINTRKGIGFYLP